MNKEKMGNFLLFILFLFFAFLDYRRRNFLAATSQILIGLGMAVYPFEAPEMLYTMTLLVVGAILVLIPYFRATKDRGAD